MSETTIEVTEEHIHNGSRRSALFCPVALALLDAGFANGMVHERGEWITLEDGEVPAPVEVSRRVRRYDRTGRMEPFTFVIDPDA